MEKETIKITNSYLDIVVNNSVIQTITKKSFTATTSYWLARVFDKLQQEAKIYLTERQKLIDKYAKRYEEDGKDWKKGDIITDGESVTLLDTKGFTKEINELTEIEINIKLDKVEFNLKDEPSCTIEEMTILLPLIEIKES